MIPLDREERDQRERDALAQEERFVLRVMLRHDGGGGWLSLDAIVDGLVPWMTAERVRKTVDRLMARGEVERELSGGPRTSRREAPRLTLYRVTSDAG